MKKTYTFLIIVFIALVSCTIGTTTPPVTEDTTVVPVDTVQVDSVPVIVLDTITDTIQ